MVDISSIGCTLDASIYILKRHFLCGPSSSFDGGQNIWDHFYQKDGLTVLEDGWQQMALKVHIIPCTMEGFCIDMIVWKSA
jgi:hypothetical protein